MVIGLLGGLAGGLAKGLLGGGTKAAASKSGKSVASKMLGAAKPEETAITKTKPKTKLVPVGGKGSAAAESAVKGLQSEEKEEKEGLPGLKSVLDSIRKSLASIKKTMGNMIRFDKQDAKEKNTRRLKALRNIAAAPVKFAGSLMGAALGAVSKTGFLDMIKNYFTQIVIGGLVLWIVKNAQEIIKKLREAFDKIKEVVDLINEYLIQPIWNIVKAVAGPIYDTIQDILAYPPIQDAVDKIANELEFIMKQIPIIGDAMNALEDRANQPRTDFSGGGGGGGGYRAAAAPSPVAGDKEFQTGVTALAKKYDLDEDDLYAVMSFETGGTFDPAQKNMAGSGATGLIQFMPETAEGLGTTTAELAGMSRTEQLKYVDKYFANKGIQGGNLDDLYMAILFPAAVGKPDDYVLFGRGARAGFTGVAYDQNRGLDLNNDGSVTKAEAASQARKHKGRAPRPPSEVTPTTPLVGGQAYGTGLKTGPSAYIGGSDDYHIDTKLKLGLSMDETIDMFDQMARAYEAQGRVIEFSNAGVASERYRSSMTRQQKEDLLRRASAAHAPRGGYRAFDYYIPKAYEDREGKSAEGAEIFVPTSPGGRLDYGTGGGYGNYVFIYDAQGRLIGKTGHGDSRFGRSSGSVRTPAQVQRTRPPADVEPIERTTTYGDQSSTIILLNNTEGTQVASAPVSSATQTQRPMQQNRGQLIAQYQSSLMLTSLNKVS